MKLNIAILPGDGVGPEVIAEAEKVLNSVGEKFKHDLAIEKGLNPDRPRNLAWSGRWPKMGLCIC